MNVTRILPQYLLFPLVLVCVGAFAQLPKPSLESIDDTVINREHVTWPSPESVLDDLRSPNDDTRLRAIRRVSSLGERRSSSTDSGDGHVTCSRLITVSSMDSSEGFGSCAKAPTQTSTNGNRRYWGKILVTFMGKLTSH